ncbi:MAG: hypothetical protein JW751_00810 [Polyangiaceae bacterium]|nr:hypothetical protein [Polyangiaceae bacterium]
MSTSFPPRVLNGWAIAALGLGVCLATVARAQPAEPAPAAPAGRPAAPAPGAAEPTAPAETAPAEATEATPIETTETTPETAAEPAAGAAIADTELAPAGANTEESSTVVVAEGGLFAESLSGAAGGVDSPGTASTGGPALELNGFVRGDFFAGKKIHASRGEIKAAYGELGLRTRVRAGTYGDAFAEARLRYGQQLDKRELFVDLREAYGNLYWGRLDLRLGHQIVVWGRADGFNPTNNITPHDLRIRSPNEDDRRLGNVGARAIVDLRPVRLEAVWMPLFRAIELPPVESYWFINLTEDFPQPELSNGLFAGRVHIELPVFDASVSFLHGYSLLPGLARDRRVFGRRSPGVAGGQDTGVGFADAGSPIEVFISRRPYQHNVLGFDFSTAISDILGMRGEIAYRRPLDDGMPWYTLGPNAELSEDVEAAEPFPDLQYTLGLDHTFGPVSVIAQYVGRYAFSWEERPALTAEDQDTVERMILPGGVFNETTGDPAGIMQPLVDQEVASKNQILFQQTAKVQHLASLRVEWLTLHDTLSVSALGLVNFTTEEWLVYPKVSYQFTDQMSGAVGAELYSGPTGTLLGLVDETLTGGYAELRMTF